jgi:hypothetical protein
MLKGKNICNKCCGNIFKNVPKTQQIPCKYPSLRNCGGMIKCDGFIPIERKKDSE